MLLLLLLLRMLLRMLLLQMVELLLQGGLVLLAVERSAVPRAVVHGAGPASCLGHARGRSDAAVHAEAIDAIARHALHFRLLLLALVALHRGDAAAAARGAGLAPREEAMLARTRYA